MHSTKSKNTKSDKIPKPIKIKKEKTEEDRTLHAMSHYIDDRLELVKQIFGTLKPKTIINLAPEFLKKKKMDEIEELCLNELLCISTKRLISIINASKCPTDTESSSDSDVEHKEEHISLEEISSDSEIDGASTSTGKKKPNGSVNKPGVKKCTKNVTEKSENNGQISVLELLELQARARAIRSQLALEPITKIEVDSDDQKKANKITSQALSKEQKQSQSDSKRKSSEKSKETVKSRTSLTSTTSVKTNSKSNESTNESATPINTAASKESEKPPTKKIKLKRNYRMSNRDPVKDDDKVQENQKTVTDSSVVSNNLKRELKSRSPSPDVIPIVPEPETLLISDSSDGEHENVAKNSSEKSAVAGKTAANNQKIKQTETAEGKERRKRKITEPEEGEISEYEENLNSNKQADTGGCEIEKNSAGDCIEKNIDDATNDMKTEATELIKVVEKPTNEREQDNVVEPVKDNTDVTDINVATAVETSTIQAMNNLSKPVVDQDAEANMGATIEDDDDQNDDIISIEGGDLESEMIEHLEEERNSKSPFANSRKTSDPAQREQDTDIISLESSEDDRDKESSESWHSRYLKSSKVSKVLAASRLGKRVRDKIKKSKRSKKDCERENNSEEKEKSSKLVFTSKHEDGSVEQYKELLEMRQRKA